MEIIKKFKSFFDKKSEINLHILSKMILLEYI